MKLSEKQINAIKTMLYLASEDKDLSHQNNCVTDEDYAKWCKEVEEVAYAAIAQLESESAKTS